MSSPVGDTYSITLKILAVGIFLVACIHIVFGVSSETFLGSGISDLSIMDPNLDSQNRFYGAAFMLFGCVLWVASNDLQKYEKILRITFICFFLAGLTRLLSIAIVGWPAAPILGLTLLEILGPPLLYVWLSRTLPNLVS